MVILRPYQRTAVDAMKASLRESPILVSPVGSGKTVMFSSLVKETGLRTLVLAHRRELVQQAAATLRKLGVPCGVIMAGSERTTHAVQVASIQTLHRRTIPEGIELVFVDEAHHCCSDGYSSLFQKMPNAMLAGGTATPFRMDGQGLGSAGFKKLVVAAYTDDLCADGTLVEPTVYAPLPPKMDGVRIIAGDYDSGESARRMSLPRIVGDAVAMWEKYAMGKRTVVFAVNVEHSKKQVEAFRAAGHRFEHLDGGSSVTQREATLDRWRSGYTVGVSQCGLFGEGFDLPVLEAAVILRPTASLCWHLQAIGRVMRACPGKAGAIVLDHAGNHDRLPPVTTRLEYSLDGKDATEAKATALSKRCPDCYLMVPPHSTECPECGHEFRPEAPEHAAGELAPFVERADVRPPIELQQRWWDALESQRQAKGWKPGSTWYRFQDRFGFKPHVVDGQIFDPAKATMETKRRVMHQFRETAAAKGFRPGWSAHMYRSVFGVWPRGV